MPAGVESGAHELKGTRDRAPASQGAFMTIPTPPQVDCEQQFPTLAVSDVLAASDFYTKKLGFRPSFTWGDPPTIAGVHLDHVEVHLVQGTPNPRGCSVSFLIGDADELYEFHRANGVEVV